MSFLFLASPTELEGGRFPAPAWAILVLGGAILVGAAAYLAVRWRRGFKRGATPTPPPSKEQR